MSLRYFFLHLISSSRVSQRDDRMRNDKTKPSFLRCWEIEFFPHVIHHNSAYHMNMREMSRWKATLMSHERDKRERLVSKFFISQAMLKEKKKSSRVTSSKAWQKMEVEREMISVKNKLNVSLRHTRANAAGEDWDWTRAAGARTHEIERWSLKQWFLFKLDTYLPRRIAEGFNVCMQWKYFHLWFSVSFLRKASPQSRNMLYARDSYAKRCECENEIWLSEC